MPSPTPILMAFAGFSISRPHHKGYLCLVIYILHSPPLLLTGNSNSLKMGILVITVDLDCSRCREKITKVLDCLKEEFGIEKVEFDEKNKDKKLVIVRGKFEADKLCKKVWCKADKVVKEILIAEVWPMPPPPKPCKPPVTCPICQAQAKAEAAKPKPEEPKPKPAKCECCHCKPKPAEIKCECCHCKPKPKPETCECCHCKPKPKPETCECCHCKPKPKPEETKKPEEKPKPKTEYKLVPYPYSYPYPMMCPSWPYQCPPHQQCPCCQKPPPPPPSPPKPPSPPPPKPCSCSIHAKCGCGHTPPVWPPPPPVWPPPWPGTCSVVTEDNSCSVM